MNADAPTESEEEIEDQNEIAAGKAPKGFKAKLLAKKKLILITLVAVLLLGGSGAGLYFSGLINLNDPHEVEVVLPDPPVYHEIPRITVDMKPSPDHARPFIRLTMQAELQGESAKLAFIANEAKIMDAIQSHLRNTTVEELEGEQGTERLREDLTTIITRAITPEIAIGVLYKDILIR